MGEAMPSYYYHLKFELYPTEDPTTASPGGPETETIWRPSSDSSVFDDLPSHPRTREIRLGARQKQRHEKSRDPAAYPTLAEHTARPANGNGVIDCGASRVTDQEDGCNIVVLSERQWRARSKSFPPPGFAAGLGPKTAGRDWRFGRLRIESFDLPAAAHPATTDGADAANAAESKMPEQVDHASVAPAASLGPIFSGPGQATKARFVPLDSKNTEVGWGIVHLYRDGEESRALSVQPPSAEDSADGGAGSSAAAGEDDCSILCIPAVPSYLSPNDFLGFVGEKWMGDVSHYRMVMTSRMNRYMVLMKFRDNARARDWRKEFDGRVFNSMEPEICHVTFIKSITFETPGLAKSHRPEPSSKMASSLKPFPPPTPNLIELPTCPVCLERMDDTTGLVTILCQHVFHCTCLQTWKGSGCPVCRATNPSLLSAADSSQTSSYDPDNPYSQPFGAGAANLCSVCDCTSDLWICLICGNVGCGRYKGGHAKEHWKDTAHSFSLELETQHVWDYAGDMWVHRLIREKGDGKVLELPSSRNNSSRRRRQREDGDDGGGERDYGDEEDVVPRAKLDRIGMEYTHLLTSQLESQRVYFEEMVSKAADKAAKAAAAAESAAQRAQEAAAEAAALRAERDALRREAMPALERDAEREQARAARSADLARTLGRSLQEEKKVSEGLMERVGHVNREMEALQRRVEELGEENEELRETNRDLTMFISGQEKLKELEEDGKVEHGELEEGKLSLPEEKKGRRKGKGRR